MSCAYPPTIKSQSQIKTTLVWLHIKNNCIITGNTQIIQKDDKKKPFKKKKNYLLTETLSLLKSNSTQLILQQLTGLYGTSLVNRTVQYLQEVTVTYASFV